MAAIDTVPAKFQNSKKIQKMATALDKTRRQLRQEKAGGVLGAVNPISVGLPALGAAWAGGWLDAKNPNWMDGRIKPSAAAGIALAVVGAMKGVPSCIYAAAGLLSIQTYAMGVSATGQRLAIVQIDADAEAGSTVELAEAA